MNQDPNPTPAFEVVGASSTTPPPLVFDSPHSWPHWPGDVATVADARSLRTSCDLWVDQIWAEALGGRAPLLAARFHRALVDANRARDDIDPELIDGPWPAPLHPSDKSRRGFGLLRRLALPGVPMYAQALPVHEVQHRLDAYYDPYHAGLAALIDAAQAGHGQVVHIDCHSMKPVGNAMNDDAGQARPDIVVSDLGGRTASAALVGWMLRTFDALGLRARYNDPYRGGELIRRHGCVARGRHSVQIEINRALYLDEQRVERSDGYARLVSTLSEFVSALLAQQRRLLGGGPAPPA